MQKLRFLLGLHVQLVKPGILYAGAMEGYFGQYHPGRAAHARALGPEPDPCAEADGAAGAPARQAGSGCAALCPSGNGLKVCGAAAF